MSDSFEEETTLVEPAQKEKKPATLDTGMLAFERSLQISEALMFAKRGDKKRPIEVVTKGVRGMTGNYEKEIAAREKKSGNSNIQTVETAFIPPSYDKLTIEFLLRVLPGSVRPSGSDNLDVTKKYEELSRAYHDRAGYHELASRYVWNLLNGRIAWRNGFQVDDAQVHLSFGKLDDENITVNVKPKIGRKKPLSAGEISELEGISDLSSLLLSERLNGLIDKFADALSGNGKPLNISVVWEGKIHEGQEVFPSQEYIRDTEKGAIGRVLAKVYRKHDDRAVAQASIHSQKIGAALAHIDDWHDQADEYGVIAVHPYGAIYGANTGLRLKDSFYEKRAKFDKLLDPKNESDLHFVMANLVRGGVLGKASS